MAMYQEGYEMYVRKCEQFNLQPINIRLYVKQLSNEQLSAYNEKAKLTTKGE